MNRFRTKKRAKDDLAAGRTSEESEQSSLSFFRKGKKVQQEEVKKEFDLSTALPTNDDFRTSLLMNNMSARFSMLREQDDPNTKIGKASDDSVLYPKRQSRLADFGFGAGGGLSDIAEVESVRGQTFLRTTSVASDDLDSVNGASVLARTRPTDGNNLFGGRQKIYKIAASSGAGMGGRALYDDDVAMSAFQRWKQTERERALDGQNDSGTEGPEEPAEHTRSQSPPPMGYNRKRETSSTTSSVSIVARNSTAATSVTSQAVSATKDGQSAPNVSTSAVTSPIPERSVTRTRRLYEQGFSQDASEHQSSVLSRIENLTRPRPFGARTPELSMNTTPQSDGSRSVLTKASAPNLRSLSPSAPPRSTGNLDLGAKMQTEAKPSNLGGSPPLSPPVSETGEQPILPTLPKDMGKATAMGIFHKPSQPYDESQYVQRQLQLQQGRETPTQRHRAESNASHAQESRPKPATIVARPAVQDARLPPTPVADSESPQSTTANSAGLAVPPEVNIERPSDKDHPAFRQSALPTPLSFNAKFGMEPSPNPKAEVSTANSQQPSPVDSPTLGPTSGLSGLVRQHLRTESVDSTLGGAGHDDSTALGSRFDLDLNTPSALGESGFTLSPWPSSDQDWIGAPSGNGPETSLGRREEGVHSKRDTSDSGTLDRSSTATEDGTDEFANQLANARRRVREKLTSYVESDSSRATSPLLLPTDPPSHLSQPSNPLGILKPKSSRGSLMDRSRNMVAGQSKGLKVLGLGAATMSTPPQSGKQSLDEKEFPSLETMKEEGSRNDMARGRHNSPETDFYAESNSSKEKDDDSNAHPGLRAFRQARRELQRRKELDTLARHQMSQTSQSPDEPQAAARADRGPRQRTPSRERRPPPVTYKQRPPSDDHSYSSPGGTRPSGERSRSGSETSASRSGSRPPRLRTNTNGVPHDQLGPPNSVRPMMRSPGLPGTDIKGSPMMPPYPYPSRGAPSPAPSPHLERSRSAANLALHTGRLGLDVHSGQPSPISPMGLPSPAPYAMGPAGSPVGTPTSLGPRPRLPSSAHSPALGPANGAMPGPMRRPVDKREISEPTFVMSTSRVPTTALPHHPQHHSPHPQYPPQPHQPPPMVPGMGDGARAPYGGPRSRSNSRAGGPAPPLPPINPRRRREDSRTRVPYDEPEMTASRLPFGDQAHNNNSSGLDHGAASEDESGNRPDHRRRLRKAHPDMQSPGSRPFPGAPRGNPSMGVPGGMI